MYSATAHSACLQLCKQQAGVEQACRALSPAICFPAAPLQGRCVQPEQGMKHCTLRATAANPMPAWLQNIPCACSLALPPVLCTGRSRPWNQVSGSSTAVQHPCISEKFRRPAQLFSSPAPSLLEKHTHDHAARGLVQDVGRPAA